MVTTAERPAAPVTRVVGADVGEVEIADLQRQRSYPAVSILMPTHRSERRSGRTRLRTLLARARERLVDEYGLEQATDVLDQLERVPAKVRRGRALDGLAVFAAEDECHILYLPVPVGERVVIGRSFATRDLLRARQLYPPYWVLALSESRTRLFEGVGTHLAEVTEGGFPLTTGEDGADGEAAGLPADFGQEPSAYRLARRRQSFQRVDGAFASFAAARPLPLVLVGVSRNLASFDRVTKHRHLHIGQVTGGHDRTSAHRLAELARPVIGRHLSAMRAAALTELETAASGRRYAAGMAEVTQLAHQGRGAHLVIEEHFGLAGNENNRVGAQPTGAEIDEVIAAVFASSGQVTFVDDDALADRGRIALILHY